MDRSVSDVDERVRALIVRIKGGEPIRPEEDGQAQAAIADGLVEVDAKGHLTLTARGRHMAETRATES